MDKANLSEKDRPTTERVKTILHDTENSMLVEKMDGIFRAVDSDQSGELSVEEIEQVFKTFGLEFSKAKIDGILHNMNIADDGHGPKDDTITRAEFLAWLEKKEAQAKDMSIHEFTDRCFAMFDKEGDTDMDTGDSRGGDGFLSVSEFQMGLKTIGMGGDHFNFNEVAAIVLEMDNNDDNRLDREDFIKWVQRHEEEDVEDESVGSMCHRCCSDCCCCCFSSHAES